MITDILDSSTAKNNSLSLKKKILRTFSQFAPNGLFDYIRHSYELGIWSNTLFFLFDIRIAIGKNRAYDNIHTQQIFTYAT